MAEQTIPTKFKLRHDIASNWTTKNPVLLDGEIGFETDTLNFKVGDGTTAWNSLSYYIPTDYVKIDTEQTILGKKYFNGGLVCRQISLSNDSVNSGAIVVGENNRSVLYATDISDYVALGNSSFQLYLQGLLARPLYNNKELAYLSDIPTIDTELSTTSVNAVQNKVVTEKLNELGKEPTLVYNTSMASTGSKSFLEDITSYNQLCFAYYNNNQEYCTMTIPVAEWQVKSTNYPLFLNSSSSANTRYMLLYPVDNTTFYIKTVRSCTLRRIWGLK